MARSALPMFVFNRGLVSRLGVARVDIKRLALGARQMINWVVRGLGGMNIRPGLGYLGSTLNNSAAKFIEFIFSVTDTALLELTDLALRVWVSDAVVTRPAVTTAITNGTFAASIAGWTDASDAGGVVSWNAGGYMQLVGNGTAAAAMTQAVAVIAPDVSVEHALNIVIARGPVSIRVGTAVGLDDYITDTALGEGSHSLTFTPTGTFYIRVESRLKRLVWVDSIQVASSGAMQVTSPYPASALSLVRHASSGDITFLACSGYQQYKIERRSTRSWSMVKYLADKGPFMVQNITTITMTPSVTSGNGTLTASAAYFKSTNVGGLFRVTHTGRRASVVLTGENQWTTTELLVTGVGTERAITVEIAGTPGWIATIQVQRSVTSASGPWSDVITYAADTTTAYTDGLDNQQYYYRIGIKTGGYTGGTINASISVGVGTTVGICRVTGYTSTTIVAMEILSEFAAVTASDNWAEGTWSSRRGWPSAVAFHEGRLWWAGKDKILGSVSDDFYNFDETTVGDSGPINRSIGSGPVDSFSWLMPLQRLVLGAQGAEFSCRSTSLDEPLTPTNFNLKPSSTQGSAAVGGIKVDASGIYVQRGGIRVYELEIDPASYDYKSKHLSAVIPEIGKPGIVRVAAQRQPETRVHFVRSDGTVAMLTFDVNEEVTCWTEVTTSGLIEDVVVLPSQASVEDDQVYYVVNRTIGGATKRYLEKWALETQCRPNDSGVLTTSRLGDAHLIYAGTPQNIIAGLSHLEGKQVVVWADGADVGYDSSGNLIYTVTGGQITLAVAASNVMVGLPYSATWQSTKLIQMQTQLQSAVGKFKEIVGISFLLADTHAKGLTFGRSFTDMDDMPSIEEGSVVDTTSIYTDYDNEQIVFPGDFSTDERVCLKAMAPRPATVLAAVPEIVLNE
jgi:hypothetical protein